MGDASFGIIPEVISTVAEDIFEVDRLGVEVALVVGGGNIFRGQENTARRGLDMDRSVADYMGMLATVINGLALQDTLEKMGLPTRVMTALSMQQVAEPYIRRRAIRHLEKGRVIILVAGTGNPYFTTDTAAALRGMEIGADVILKATRVDGVYDKDPLEFKDARKFDALEYIDILNKNLRFMDTTAVSLCMDNKLPIVIFNLNKKGNIQRVVLGEKIGTIVK